MEQPGPDIVFERGACRVGGESVWRHTGNHAVAIELELVGIYALRDILRALTRRRERGTRQRQCDGKEHCGLHRPLPARLAQSDAVVMTHFFRSQWVTRCLTKIGRTVLRARRG